MSHHTLHQKRHRAGATSPVVVLLLAGILLAVIVLIIVLLNGRNPSTSTESSGKQHVPPDKEVNRSELANPPKSPKMVGDTKRIKEVAQAGKTYDMLVKGNFEARVEDKDWGAKQITNLAYAYEMPVSRTIESNDGKKIVEVRRFGEVRTIKILAEVESVTIELGAPGQTILGAILDWVQPGTGVTVLAAKPIAEKILRGGAQLFADSNLKVFGTTDSLSGKKVRITFVDGTGVESIVPMGCSLSETEKDFIFNTATLSDYNAMPDIDIAPGKPWTIDGSEFSGFLDPSWRGVPVGDVIVSREENYEASGKQYAKLTIKKGFLTIDSSDSSKRRIGSFTPRGSLIYNISDGYVETASLKGDLQIEEVSTDHILFEASFKTRPQLQISYSCKIQ